MTNPIDILIGSRVRVIRESRNMPLALLASETGISFPQLARYENGFDRYSPSHLLIIARHLKLDVSHLFSDPWTAEDNRTAVLSLVTAENEELDECNSVAELDSRLENALADVRSLGKKIAALRKDVAATPGDAWADSLREKLGNLMLAVCDIAIATGEQESAE